MRVALLSCNAQARNAIGNQVAEKAAFFLERGAEVRVFLEHLDHLHPELSSIATQVTRVERRGAAWDYLKNCDLVCADYAQTYDLLHYLPLLIGQKPRLVLDYHGVTPAAHWEGPQRDLLTRSARERGVVWCADAALAHSQFARQELQRAAGYPNERIQVQPYPTDATLFHPGPGDELRRRLGLDDGPVLLYVGRLAASKRVPLLIEALPLVPKAQVLIVGDAGDVYGIEARRCLELAERLGLSSRVHFLGQLDDGELAEIYRVADVLVLPSLHEGYCLPAVEAMASGLPGVAARTTALPETLGDAGLTFTPDDSQDLARQVNRLVGWHALRCSEGREQPARPSRIAIVAFRFGAGIVGGAERSLLTIAQTLRRGGVCVEVYTTCTSHESVWTNDLPAGTSEVDGLTVQRFPIDPHDRAAHHETIRRITAANGQVDAETATEYLRHSIHSTELLKALQAHCTEFDAIITGPYLFGLTHDVSTAFPSQTLLLPCYHDEAYARLSCWRQAYSEVGGVLYHSPEEQQFAEGALGLNHPRATCIGTWLDVMQSNTSADNVPTPQRYLVYCGRYSNQKNLPLLLEFAERYARERPNQFQFVFLGAGEVRIPQAAWASDRGRVGEEEKRQTLAHAAALVQLSTQESLSLVALEAWAQRTPVIVHRDCAVLAGQTERAQGGQAIDGYDDFARTLDDLWARPQGWQTFGANGRAYVEAHYGAEADFRQRLQNAIDDLRKPLRDCMRERGLRRAADRDRPKWRERFGQFIERLLDDVPSPRTLNVAIEPQTTVCRATASARTLLVPVRVVNRGTLPAFADGPAKTQLVAEVIDDNGRIICTCSRTDLPALIVPGQSKPAAVALSLPAQPGQYRLSLRAESETGDSGQAQTLPLYFGVDAPAAGPADVDSFLEFTQAALAEAHRLQRLPDDYVDVTEGRFARLKRWLKQKLLGNFKKGYIDVLSRQQTQVNQQVLTALQQLTECCATLEHAVRGLQRRLDEQTKPPAIEQEQEVLVGHPRREEP